MSMNRSRPSLFVEEDDDQSNNSQNVQSQSIHREQGSNRFGTPHGHGSDGSMRTSNAMPGNTYQRVRQSIRFNGQDNDVPLLNLRHGNVNHQGGSIPTRSFGHVSSNNEQVYDNVIDPNLRNDNQHPVTVQSQPNSAYSNGGMHEHTQDFSSSPIDAELETPPESSPPRMSSAIGFGPRQYGNDHRSETVPSFRGPARGSMQSSGNTYTEGGYQHNGSVEMHHQTFAPTNPSPGFHAYHGYTGQNGQGRPDSNDTTASGGSTHVPRDVRFQSGNMYGEGNQQFGADSEDGPGVPDAGTMNGVMSNNFPADYCSGFGVNNDPSFMPASQSQLMTHSKPKHKISKHSPKKKRGAMDPDNIFIVDCYDNLGMDFEAIAERLNNKYEMSGGKPPSFTTNSVHNRYNRSAPVIYKADGRVFIPICERKRHTQEELTDMSNGINSTQWTPGMDQLLRDIEETYQKSKWQRVADQFNETTGENVTAGAIATRFGMLRN